MNFEKACYLETSAKNKINILHAFSRLAEMLIHDQILNNDKNDDEINLKGKMVNQVKCC